jgi:GTP 3',8-cyclase
MLIDQHGRRIRKLRLSLTDKCNLRCHYCMPVEQKFMDESRYMSPEEIVEVLSELKTLGLEEVRLTGGEPLMRKSFEDIVSRIGNLNFRKLGLTTNAIFLEKYLDVLKANRVFHLNISLDSLNEENFKRITFGNHLKKVISNIRLAVSNGFVVKINTVMMKGVNDHELLDFIRFSEDESVEVRFLELMRIGHARADQVDQFIAADEMMKRMGHLRPITMPLDSTSFNFVTENGGNVGFIASESRPFCGQCSRWRLSADGILRACLMKDDGKSIRNIKDRSKIYHALLGMKPILRPVEVTHSMNAVGG